MHNPAHQFKAVELLSLLSFFSRVNKNSLAFSDHHGTDLYYFCIHCFQAFPKDFQRAGSIDYEENCQDHYFKLIAHHYFFYVDVHLLFPPFFFCGRK